MGNLLKPRIKWKNICIIEALLIITLIIILGVKCFASNVIQSTRTNSDPPKGVISNNTIWAPSNENYNRRYVYTPSNNIINRIPTMFSNLDGTPNPYGVFTSGMVNYVNMGDNHNRLHFKMSINKNDHYIVNTMLVYVNDKLIHTNCMFNIEPEDYWIWIYEQGQIKIRFESIDLNTGNTNNGAILTLAQPEIYWE